MEAHLPLGLGLRKRKKAALNAGRRASGWAVAYCFPFETKRGYCDALLPARRPNGTGCACAVGLRAFFLHAAARLDLDVLTQPRGECLFLQRAFGKGDVERIQLDVVRFQHAFVEHEEGFAGHRRANFMVWLRWTK